MNSATNTLTEIERSTIRRRPLARILGDQTIVLSPRSIGAVGAQIMVNTVQGDDRLTGGFVPAIAGH